MSRPRYVRADALKQWNFPSTDVVAEVEALVDAEVLPVEVCVEVAELVAVVAGVGDTVGDAVGDAVVGAWVGEAVGSEVVGAWVGDVVGSDVVGAPVGDIVGDWVGAWVGNAVGDSVLVAVEVIVVLCVVTSQLRKVPSAKRAVTSLSSAAISAHPEVVWTKLPLKLHEMPLSDWRLVPANSSRMPLRKVAVLWHSATEFAVMIEWPSTATHPRVAS